MFRRSIVVVLALVLVGSFVAVGLASYHAAAPEPSGDKAIEQINTAMFHAGELAQAATYSGAVTHLGHALNCLQGSGGDNFNADWGHPCGGQGDGALNDLDGVDNEPAARILVAAADSLAVAGVNAASVEEVHNAALGVVALLRLALEALEG